MRALKASAWLGWAVASNWTHPALYALYAMVRPVAMTLILLCMYGVVMRSPLRSPFFAQAYWGNTLFVLVAALVFGMSSVVHEDREMYQMIRYVYIAPVRFTVYMTGRCLTHLAQGLLSVAVMVVFGLFVLGLPWRPEAADVAVLAAALVLGVAAMIGLGMILAGVSLVTARHDGMLGEGVAGVLYLVCGAVYPIDVLPKGLQVVAEWIPVTHWLELGRRAVFGESFSELFRARSDGELLFGLALSTVVLVLVGGLVFRWCETAARRRGVIDAQRHY